MSKLYPLLVVLSLAIIPFSLLWKVNNNFLPSDDFTRIRNTWILLTAAFFLSGNFYVFILACLFVVLLYAKPDNNNRAVYYLALLSAVPSASIYLPGFGSINVLFELSYPRFLVLVLLVPYFLMMVMNNLPARTEPAKQFYPADKYVVLLFVLMAILGFRDKSLTDGLRHVFLLMLDVLIPYFVISRSINSTEDMRKAMFAFLLLLAPLTLIGVFESFKHWPLYAIPKNELTMVPNNFSDQRIGFMRAKTVFFGPIIFGFVQIIAVSSLVYFKPWINRKALFYVMLALFLLASFSSLSRGPWVGLAIFFLIFALTGKNPAKSILTTVSAFLFMIPLLSLTRFWEKFVQLLPFIGTIRADTVSYREELIKQSWLVVQKNPLLGSTTYLETPELEIMRQGQGIIDLVNTYIQITLEYGFVGLSLFVLIFLVLMKHTYIIVRTMPDGQDEEIRLGRVLLATNIAILFTIGTVSSLNYIPYFYWSYIAVTAAYVNVSRFGMLPSMKKLDKNVVLSK